MILDFLAALILALFAGLCIFEIAESDRGGIRGAWREMLEWLDGGCPCGCGAEKQEHCWKRSKWEDE